MKKCKWILVAMIIVVVAVFCLGCTTRNNDNGSNTDTGNIVDTVEDKIEDNADKMKENMDNMEDKMDETIHDGVTR